MKPRYHDIRDRLRYVQTNVEDYDLTGFPDFLVIGPQRTGTTWLYWNLRDHPHVFMPDQKELYYWNNLEYPELHPKSLPPVGQELQWYLDQFVIDDEYRDIRKRECRESFDCDYEPRVVGEGSATYAASLKESVIREIVLLNPDIKIVVFVRDPVERAWSHAKKDLSKFAKRPIEDVREKEWIDFLSIPHIEQCGRFSVFLDRWGSVIPKDNLMVRPFTHIATQPDVVLTDFYGLIGVSSERAYIESRMNSKVMRTENVPVPDNLRAFLTDMFGDEIEELRKRGLI